MELVISRLKTRVKEGGHNIPENVIRRRYEGGLTNFFELYILIVDNWMLINNSGEPYEIIAEGSSDGIEIVNNELWENLKSEYYGKQQ